MAKDYFIGYTQKDKLDLLRGITESMLTGQIVRVKTSRDVETQFNPLIDNSLMYDRLCTSIANDPNFDANDPAQAACLGNQRPGITRGCFTR